MLPSVAEWFARRTTSVSDYDAAALAELKAELGSRVSVVLPARNEAATVGDIVTELDRLRSDRPGGVGLIDQVLVIDSGSTDETSERAAAAGAEVVRQQDLLPSLGDRPGKGEALWKSLAGASGDLIVFLDADLVEFDADYVIGLLGPLLTEPTVAFVKGTYDRPLALSGSYEPTGGGRVTELVARPLLNQFWPQLAGFVQPLGGEYAARRDVLERVPFAGGFGLELGLLVDVHELIGLDRMAQVDLGRRLHRHHSDELLGVTAGQVMLAAWSRLDRLGRVIGAAAPSSELTQFRRGPDGLVPVVTQTAVPDRPPMIEVPEYRERLALKP